MLRANHFHKASDAGFALRLSAFFVAIFFIVGCYMPYLPLWLKWRGLTDFQISLIYAVPVFVRALFTPAMTFLADRTGRPVRLLYWLVWGTLFCVLILPFTDGFPAIFAIVLLYTLFWMSVIPITDSVALTGAREARADYGRMRLWGSLSYIAMTSAGGVAVDFWGPEAALWLFIGSAGCVVVVVHWLPSDSDRDRAAGDGQSTALPALRFADVGRLLTSPQLWLFLAATSATQSAHAVYYIFGTLHWTSLGISPTVIGALWGIGVIAEIALFAYSARIGRLFGPVQLLALGAGAATIRWTITAYDPPLAILFLVQTLHGLTFGAAHMGAMQFMTRSIPKSLAVSAQGLYASITMGIGMGLASLAAGPLYRSYGGSAYLAMSALGFFGFVMTILLMRRWQGGTIIAPDEMDKA